MTDPKKDKSPLNDGYVPRPNNPPYTPPKDGGVKNGYTPTSEGDNPTNRPPPPKGD